MFNVEYFNNIVYKGISNRLKENYISKNYPEFYNFIIDNFDNNNKFIENLYIMSNSEYFCYCGNKTKFISFKEGYLKYCSTKCSRNSIEVKEKYKNTCLDKYGVDNVSKIDEIKSKKKDTYLDKYGVSTILQHHTTKNIIKNKYGVDNVFKSKNIQDSIKNTNILKYGNECSLLNEHVKLKSKNTLLNKYGQDHFSKTDEFKSLISKLNNNKYIKELELTNDYQLLDKFGNMNLIYHNICDSSFTIQTQLIRLRRNKKNEICLNCNKITYHKENELYDYVSTLHKKVSKYRDNKYEIDVYLPDLNIGFEFNGLYWHSEIFKDKNYHIDKTNYFKNKNIQIFHIWEDDWKSKEDIIKSVIKSKMGIYENIIYARNCKFVEISNLESKKFLNENHLQGWCVSKYRYGLLYNNELISVLTFGKERLNLGIKKANLENLELLRFSIKKNFKIIGGFSKIMKNSIKLLKNKNIKKIITYSDASTFNGHVYLKYGFEYLKLTEPGFNYIVNGKRENRFSFNKQKLVKMGFDSNKSASNIMFENEYYKIYDCGNYKFNLNISN